MQLFTQKVVDGISLYIPWLSRAIDDPCNSPFGVLYESDRGVFVSIICVWAD